MAFPCVECARVWLSGLRSYGSLGEETKEKKENE